MSAPLEVKKKSKKSVTVVVAKETPIVEEPEVKEEVPVEMPDDVSDEAVDVTDEPVKVKPAVRRRKSKK